LLSILPCIGDFLRWWRDQCLPPTQSGREKNTSQAHFARFLAADVRVVAGTAFDGRPVAVLVVNREQSHFSGVPLPHVTTKIVDCSISAG
jgi:hypothetical protein